MIVKAKAVKKENVGNKFSKLKLFAETEEEQEDLAWLFEELGNLGISVIRDLVASNTKPI